MIGYFKYVCIGLFCVCGLTQGESTEDVTLEHLLANITPDNEKYLAIEAELILAHKDLQNALKNEASMQQKLTQLQEDTNKELSRIKDELEEYKIKVETATHNFNKVLW